MSEAFSHEEFMRAGNAVAGLLEAMEDPDLQQHMLDARDALQKAADTLADRGVDQRQAWLSLTGIILGPILPD